MKQKLLPEKKTSKKKLESMKSIDPKCPIDFIRQIDAARELVSPAALENKHPQLAAVALWRIAQGEPLYRVAKDLNLSKMTLRSVVHRHSKALTEQKAKFSKLYAAAAEEYTHLLFEKADRLMDNPETLDAVSPDRLAVTVGILTDHASRLSGMASAVIEHRKGASIDDAAAMIAAARERIANKTRNQAIDAVIVE